MLQDPDFIKAQDGSLRIQTIRALIRCTLHLTRLESCSTRERDPRDVHRFSRISPLPSSRPSSRKFRALAGKNGEVSSSPGNRATFAGLPRLFGDSCANLFRARNPICLRLIVLLLSPFPSPPHKVASPVQLCPRIIATLQ